MRKPEPHQSGDSLDGEAGSMVWGNERIGGDGHLRVDSWKTRQKKDSSLIVPHFKFTQKKSSMTDAPKTVKI